MDDTNFKEGILELLLHLHEVLDRVLDLADLRKDPFAELELLLSLREVRSLYHRLRYVFGLVHRLHDVLCEVRSIRGDRGGALRQGLHRRTP